MPATSPPARWPVSIRRARPRIWKSPSAPRAPPGSLTCRPSLAGLDPARAGARRRGVALGEAPAGEKLARTLGDAVAAMRKKAQGLKPVRVIFLVGREPLVIAGRGSYPGELVEIAGGVNLAEGKNPWPTYPI